MDKWEYKTIQLEPTVKTIGKGLMKETVSVWDSGYFNEQLNSYGLQGWELVSCFGTEAKTRGDSFVETGGTNGVFAVFKRKFINQN